MTSTASTQAKNPVVARFTLPEHGAAQSVARADIERLMDGSIVGLAAVR